MENIFYKIDMENAKLKKILAKLPDDAEVYFADDELNYYNTACVGINTAENEILISEMPLNREFIKLVEE